MNKLFLLMFVLLVPLVSAECDTPDSLFVSIVDVCTSPDDGVCDPGENPFMHGSDCDVDREVITSFSFVYEYWFLKLVAILLLYYLFFQTDIWRDNNFWVIVLLVVGSFVFLPDLLSGGSVDDVITTSTTMTTTTTFADDTILVIEPSGLSKFWDKFIEWGGGIYPSHPLLSWVIVFFLFWMVFIIFTFGTLVIEKKVFSGRNRFSKF